MPLPPPLSYSHFDAFVDVLRFRGTPLQAALASGETVDVGWWRYRLVAGAGANDFRVEVVRPLRWWCRLFLWVMPGARHAVRRRIESRIARDEGGWRPLDHHPPQDLCPVTGIPVWRVDLPAQDLRGAQPHRERDRKKTGLRANFERAALAGASFEGNTLSESSFQAADLTKADFTAAQLYRTDFGNACCALTRMEGLRLLSCCNFVGANLVGTQLSLAQDYAMPVPDGSGDEDSCDQQHLHHVSGLLISLATMGDDLSRKRLAQQLLERLLTHRDAIIANTSRRARWVSSKHIEEFALQYPGVFRTADGMEREAFVMRELLREGGRGQKPVPPLWDEPGAAALPHDLIRLPRSASRCTGGARASVPASPLPCAGVGRC